MTPEERAKDFVYMYLNPPQQGVMQWYIESLTKYFQKAEAEVRKEERERIVRELRNKANSCYESEDADGFYRACRYVQKLETKT